MLPQLLTRESLPSNAVTVSHNQLVNHWYRCPYRWKLIYRDKLERGADEYGRRASEGTIWHQLAAEFYNYFIQNEIPVGQIPMAELARLQNGMLQKFQNSQAELNDFYHMMGIFMLYCNWAAEHETVDPLIAEAEIFAPTGLQTPEGHPIFLHAIMDLIAELNGDLGIIDHKTHEGRSWDDEDVFFDIQTMLYLCVLWANGLEPKWVAINAINVKEYKTKGKQLSPSERFRRIYVPRDMFRQRGYYDEILRHIKMMYSADAVYPRKLEKSCKYCAFKDHCTMAMRGTEGSLAVLDNFRNKPPVEMSFDSWE